MIPLNSTPDSSKPVQYRPVPFNFVDLEEKASDYLNKVKAEAMLLMTTTREEVARLREATLTEIENNRKDAAEESERVRTELSTLRKRLADEETHYKTKKDQLEGETLRLKSELRQNEDVARKKGYDEGLQLGQEEGFKKGYADGELQATIDYAEKIRHEASIQLAAQLETLLPSIQEMVDQLGMAKQSFLQLWEESAIGFAAAIAERAISRHLPEMVDVPLKLLREGLELAAGNAAVKIRVNPDDYEALKPQMDMLITQMSTAAKTEVSPDPRITKGGCLLETSFGVIDQTIESRIERIKMELV